MTTVIDGDGRRPVSRIICLLSSLLLLTACGPEPEKKPLVRPVMAMRVADSTGLMERAFPGRARAGLEVNMSFRVPGPLVAFPVSVGDEVKAGDVVARIDPTDYETAVRTLEGQLERERAVAKRARQDLERNERILKDDPGAISQAAIDRSRQVLDSANAAVRSLRASVKTARDQLSYTVLEAPFDGVVVETYAENFETVISKQPILRLLNPESIEFLISVPENLIGLAPYVESIVVKFDALPDIEVPAEVKEIGKEATQATRTYPATLVMGQPPGAEILPGMAGKAYITSRPPTDHDEIGIEIPATAIFKGEEPQKAYVWVVDETSKTLGRREVQVGGLSRFGMRVTAGLEPGELIVTKGVHSVIEGQQVRILESARADAAS
jgi:RND family efflux transporter MFP subunit